MYVRLARLRLVLMDTLGTWGAAMRGKTIAHCVDIPAMCVPIFSSQSAAEEVELREGSTLVGSAL